MFSPPPSPLPISNKHSQQPYSVKILSNPVSSPSFAIPGPGCSLAADCDGIRKRFSSWRWTVLAFPLTLILITASTRCMSHPATLKSLLFTTSPNSSPRDPVLELGSLHQRHVVYERQHNNFFQSPAGMSPSSDLVIQPSTTSTIPTRTSSATTTTNPSISDQQLPPIPNTPPVLPTPFPQPLDNLTQNFSSVSCFNFFTNMTNSDAFRSCRSLSLLIQSSSGFLQAQKNLTLLNALIWGTCNTTTEAAQCSSNMAWFASELRSACATDLVDRNAYATNTLVGLRAYSLMREVGCLSAPSSPSTTSSYCYITAAYDSNPADMYVYSLPLGLPMPSSSVPLCSACTGTIMQHYAAALQDPNQAADLTRLRDTYNTAAVKAAQKCGAAYVQTSIASSSATAVKIHSARRSWLLALTVTISLVALS